MTLTADTITIDAPDLEDQTVWVTFRLTPIEREELRDHAHAARISVSELVRGRVLGLPPPKAAVPTINSQVYSELGRIGNNLNQLTKLVHEAGQLATGPIQTIGAALTKLKSLLDQVRREVIGVDQESV